MKEERKEERGKSAGSSGPRGKSTRASTTRSRSAGAPSPPSAPNQLLGVSRTYCPSLSLYPSSPLCRPSSLSNHTPITTSTSATSPLSNGDDPRPAIPFVLPQPPAPSLSWRSWQQKQNWEGTPMDWRRLGSEPPLMNGGGDGQDSSPQDVTCRNKCGTSLPLRDMRKHYKICIKTAHVDQQKSTLQSIPIQVHS